MAKGGRSRPRNHFANEHLRDGGPVMIMPAPRCPRGPVVDQPGFFKRFTLGFVLFWKMLFDAELAGRVDKAASGAAPEALPAPKAKVPEPKPEPKPEPPKPEPAKPKADPNVPAFQLLAALQREGRFVDFVQEDLGAGVSDADIGAAARLVHEGCKKVVSSWFDIEVVWPGQEGARVTVEEGFDSRRVRLTGNVTGEPPFSGTLAHHGWRATGARLPTVTEAADPSILAPAEVEL